MTAVIFLIDLSFPVNIAVWLAYLFPLLLLETSPRRIPLRLFLAVWVLLTLVDLGIGAYVSRTEAVLFDRTMGLLMFALLVFFMDRRARIAQALRESEIRFRQLFETMSEGFALFGARRGDPDGSRDLSLLDANPAFGRLVETRPDETVGKTVRDALPQLGSHWVETLADVAARGETIRVEEYVERIGKHLEGLAFCPSPGKAGLLLRDVTERKRRETALAESEERLRFAMEAADIGGWHWDLMNGEIRWTEKCKGLLGLPSDSELSYHDFLDKVASDDRGNVDHAVREAIDKCGDCSADFRVVWPDKSEHWLFMRGQVHYNELAGPLSIFSVYGIVMDIAQRKAWEERLARAASELKRSNEDLERFAYVVSHDLQEPLRTVRSFVQLLAKRYAGKLDAQADEYISFAVNGVARMQDLISDLLIYSRAGTSDMRLSVVDSNRALDSALEALKDSIQGNDALVTRGPLPEVMADESQLAQLLQNLVGNAVKFRREGVRPEAHVSAERRGRQWLFSVKDNGIGIDARYFEKIFTIFQRLNAQDEYPGTGIGLAICRRIAQRHGGEMCVESEPGSGSTFHFTLDAPE